jgi:hypothetical protein
MVAMGIKIQYEIESILTPCPIWLAYKLDMDITLQRHDLSRVMIAVARDNRTQKLIAWSWINRGIRSPFSRDEIAEAKMADVDLSLPMRTRVTITTQILLGWENWAKSCKIPVLASASIRQDQATFLKLHEKLGFTVRGGMAQKRINI